MRKRLFNKNTGLALISLLFSLLLFLVATSNNYTNSGNVNRVTETYTNTLENVPIDIKYDSNEYFISGYSYETSVYLTATNRIQLDAEINANTRTFKVVADLTNVGVGTSKVNLQVKDLPAGMTAEVTPATMTITIGKRKSKTFPVEALVAESQIAEGYQLRETSLDVTEVEVVSDETIIDQIDHVVASLPSDVTLSEDYEGEVILQAVSATGTVLASVIEPAKATLKVNLTALTKVVPIEYSLTGTNATGISYEVPTTSAVIQGSQTALDAVDKVTVSLDVSDVTKETTKTVELKADGVVVSPAEVAIKLKPNK